MATDFLAAVLTGIDRPLEVMSLSLLDRLKPGQVLVKMKSASVCGSQLLEISGHKGNSKFLPHLLGHEGFAEVLELGPGVTKFVIGDTVVMHWRRSGGQESDNPRYKGPGGKVIGAGKLATFASLSVVSENRLTKVPHDVDPDLATLLGCGLSTGMSAVLKQGNLKANSSVLILGAGGVGLAACVGATLIGAKKVVVVDKDPAKEDLAKGCGATVFLDSTRLSDVLIDSDDSNSRFEAVFETTGSPSMMGVALTLTRDSGTVVQVGQSNPNENVNLGPQVNAFGLTEGKTVVFSQGGGFNPDVDLVPYITNLTYPNNTIWRNLMGPRGNLEQVNELIEGLRSGVPGRPMLIF